MPQITPAPVRVCPDCDGHASAAVSIGARCPDGTLPTITVVCRACSGLGSVPARRPTLAPAGK
ncbi:hypothetical protein [Peterkaempfera griseoplana]|uniref:hypothetical protein n=1 Tax=Peterkaempfera griseoplana TaxID=66896 RepID=UPI0006E1ADF8|nr:hypothetical protein [Peterkaempfera griseoplana]